MALLWSDGFGAYGGSVASMLDGSWAEVSSGAGQFALSTARARTGTYSLEKGGSTTAPQDARRVFGGAKGTVGVGFALYMAALPTGNDRVKFAFRDSANAEQVRVVVQSTGDIAAIRGSTTLGTTTTPPLTAAAWAHVEIKVVCHATAGAVEVRVNQVTVLNLTGVNTKNTALAGVDQFSFCNTLSNSPWPVTNIDDMFAWDTLGAGPTDFIGDKKVIEDFADADGAEQDWTRSSGSTSWPLLKEAPPDGEASYVSTSAVGNVLGLKFPALPSEVSSVVAVSFEHTSRKTDAGNADLTGGVKSGSATADGPSTPMTTAYTRRWDHFTVNPATSAPFTPAAAGAAEYRLTRSA